MCVNRIKDIISPISAIQVSYSDGNGGAARAAFRLHQALRRERVASQMLVQQNQHDDPFIHGSKGKLRRGLNLLRASFGGMPTLLQKTSNSAIHSCAWLPSRRGCQINQMDIDIVNLHWISWDMLSVAEIGRIKKPLVWTLHDMWAFCGAEHYAPDVSDARWRIGYTKKNRDINTQGIDLNRWVWNRKRKKWKQPVQIVAPSHWLANCVKNSALMHDWPVEVIANPLDVDVFKPIDRHFACEVLNFSPDSKYILFGAIGGNRDPRKGFGFLQEALLQLSETWSGPLSCIICGQSKPLNVPDIGFPIYWMGQIYDDCTLALLYNISDVVVVPSRQENLPQMATEAHACGVPVVAFNTTGLPDIVSHEETGYLAQPFDTADLSHGIKWILEDENRRSQLGKQARKKAVENWAYPVIAAQYQALYKSVLLKEC